MYCESRHGVKQLADSAGTVCLLFESRKRWQWEGCGNQQAKSHTNFAIGPPHDRRPCVETESWYEAESAVEG